MYCFLLTSCDSLCTEWCGGTSVLLLTNVVYFLVNKMVWETSVLPPVNIFLFLVNRGIWEHQCTAASTPERQCCTVLSISSHPAVPDHTSLSCPSARRLIQFVAQDSNKQGSNKYAVGRQTPHAYQRQNMRKALNKISICCCCC